jgi:hypothetical protein
MASQSFEQIWQIFSQAEIPRPSVSITPKCGPLPSFCKSKLGQFDPRQAQMFRNGPTVAELKKY